MLSTASCRYIGWHEQATATQQTLRAVWGADATHVFAVGDAGTILFGNGTSWISMPSGTDATLRAVSGSSATDVYAVGDYALNSATTDVSPATILHYDGSDWKPVTAAVDAAASATFASLTGVWVGTEGVIALSIFQGGSGGFQPDTLFCTQSCATGSWMTGSSGAELSAIWGSDLNNVYAVENGANGDASVDIWLGGSWLNAATDVPGPLVGLSGTSPSNVYAVNASGTLVRNAGNNWHLIGVTPGVPSPTSLTWLWVAGGGAQPLFATDANGQIWRSNGTGTWTPTVLDSAAPRKALFAVWGTSGEDVYAVGAGGTILHYQGAANGALVPPPRPSLRAVWASPPVTGSPREAVAVGDGGSVFRYRGQVGSSATSAGGDWFSVDAHVSAPLRAVWGASASDVFAAGDAGTIIHFDGNDWSSSPSGTQAALYALWGRSSTEAYAAGDAGLILRWDGSSWSSEPSATTQTLRTLGGDDTAVFAAGDGGTLTGRDPSSGQWSTIELGPDENFRALTGAFGGLLAGDEDVIFAHDGPMHWSVSDPDGIGISADQAGTIVTPSISSVAAVPGFAIAGVDNPGILHPLWGLLGQSPYQSWSSPVDTTLTLDPFTQALNYDIFGGNAGGVLRGVAMTDAASGAAGEYDVFLATSIGPSGCTLKTNDGIDAFTGSCGDPAGYYAIAAHSDELPIALGYGQVVAYDGSTWAARKVAPPHFLHALWAAPDGAFFGVGEDGAIFHYDGTTWTQQPTSVTSTLRAVHGLTATTLFAVGDGGTFLAGDGSTWKSIQTPTVANLEGVWAASPTDVFLVGTGGIVLHYDGTTVSQTASLGADLDLHAVWGTTGPVTNAYVAGDDGMLFQSSDGVSWSTVTTSTSLALRALGGTGARDVWAAGDAGVILHFDGSAWQNVRGTSLNDIRGVAVTNHQVTFAGVDLFSLFRQDASLP